MGDGIQWLKKIFKFTFPKKSEAFLLGIIGDAIPNKTHNLLLYTTVAATTIVHARNWRPKETPGKEQWLYRLTEYAELASMTTKIRNQDEKHTRMSGKYLGSI